MNENEPSQLHDRPAGLAATTPEPWSHPWHDQLGLRYHQAIADRILANPDLRRVAVENIDRWIARNDYPPSVLTELGRWRQLLTTAPVAELLTAMLDPTDHGHRMRQNTPFAGILSQDERRRIRDEHEAATTH